MGRCWRILPVVLFAPILVAQTASSPPDDAPGSARQLLRDGEFRRAAEAFQTMIAQHPTDAAYAGLVQSYLKQDDVKAAEKSSQQAAAAYPQSALAHAARGDVYFRRGLFAEAENEYTLALKLDRNCARAWLGTGKLEQVHAQRHLANDAIAKSHQLDPEDGDALYEWAIRQPYPANISALEKHLAEFRSDPEIERHERDYVALLKAIGGRRVWILDPEVERSEIKLDPMLFGPDLARRGYSVNARFNDRSSATLLLDTGSSGVTISRKFAEKIGATKLADQMLQGIGKGRSQASYLAWVDKITIGNLQFHDCFVHVVPEAIAETDGLIGTDIFTHFLVTLDFRSGRLLLDPLFAAADSEQTPPAAAQSFVEADGFGHLLLLSTRTEKSAAGLFVLDSGSNVSSISQELATHLNRMRPVSLPVTGAGGRTNSTYLGDGITLEFAKMRRGDQRLISVDLRSISKNIGTEISGQIGFSTLESLRIVIDYRDGLVKFEEKTK